MPFSVCASMFLMPETLVLIAYWLYVVTRCSISGVLRPVYCQMTVTTGMLISGKMSIGITATDEMPRNMINAAKPLVLSPRADRPRYLHMHRFLRGCAPKMADLKRAHRDVNVW